MDSSNATRTELSQKSWDFLSTLLMLLLQELLGQLECLNPVRQNRQKSTESICLLFHLEYSVGGIFDVTNSAKYHAFGYRVIDGTILLHHSDRGFLKSVTQT